MKGKQRAFAASAVVVALTTAGLSTGGAATGASDHGAAGRQQALAAGMQVGRKDTSRPTVTIGGKTYDAANPYLSEPTAGQRVDWAYWRRHLDAQGAKRARARESAKTKARLAVPTPFAYDEQEPAGGTGYNDAQPNAEQIARFGTDRRFKAVKILGSLAPSAADFNGLATSEDQGAIPIATKSGLSDDGDGVEVNSVIGDGPHGTRTGDGSDDFDFFQVDLAAGQTITASTLKTDELDTVLAVYDAEGDIVAANDDTGDGLQSRVSYQATDAGSYSVMVAGYDFVSPVPDDPFDSGSGAGFGDEGTYDLTLALGPADKDFYGVHLRSGDVVGGTLNGGASTVTVHRVDGEEMVGSEQDASSAYPTQSPLPGGGSTFAYVAEEPGWYAVSATNGEGDYQMLLEAYRPGTETTSTGTRQTIFLDFDGERVNTGIWGGPGVVTLSPLRSFLARWGLTNKDENAVIDGVVAEVKENISQTLRTQGLNPNVKVRVLNSRDNKDPFGNPNVSRVIVGGTIEQSGIPTIGIAQSIDPGNYAHEESALVLLDEVSNPAGPDDSFNTYLEPQSNKVAFVGQALGNVVSHEIGHYIGSFHTDNVDDITNLMDAGGTSFDDLYGVGPDGVGGTADDPDVDYGEDGYIPEEGFTGLEDTLNNSAWGPSLGQAAP
jgi:hypothetical protein